MTRVLFVGVYRDGTGWANGAIQHILALDAAGIDVVCRPLKLNDASPELPRRILELEAKPSHGCDVVLQNVLPHQMDYNGRFRKNIGYYYSETSTFAGSAWPARLNQLDELWVANRQQVEAARQSGVTRPVKVVPPACDLERFMRSYQPLDVLRPYRDQGEFLFYWVGEYNRRKNLGAAVRAFHLEFQPHEPVRLVIKTHKPGMSPAECQQHVEADCQKVKDGLKLRSCKSEVVLTQRLTESGMMKLHQSCDCFVATSFGEAWCIPAFEAMASGKTPIVPASTGFLDYVDDNCGWLVETRPEPVFLSDDGFEDLFTGQESWASVDVLHLRRCMREAFEGPRQDKADRGIERAYDFSHLAVGQIMRNALA
jgi:glycosyltransferase involved in cell wall biosynthesis